MLVLFGRLARQRELKSNKTTLTCCLIKRSTVVWQHLLHKPIATIASSCSAGPRAEQHFMHDRAEKRHKLPRWCYYANRVF